ncbi:MAG: DDE-type integrase/transposase/recombinase [Kiritimatiellae bacterium]|nr:DDE-type integrase/transposase/recombinase [Kiritimatiellia bacterium]
MTDKVPQNGLGVSEADQKRALARYAAVCWVSERASKDDPSGWTLQTATAEASRKLWDGFQFSAGSIERYYYAYRKGDFNALMPVRRGDKGQCRALSPENQEKLLSVRLAHPGMDATVLVDHLVQTGELEGGTFSMSSVYRLFAAHGVDRSSLKAGSFQPDDGPQKAFETPMPNMLWMADMMYGPTIVTEDGKAMHTRLFALIDDHSRLCPYGAYFASEGSDCFMAVLYEAIRTRGVPDKLYTDNGKVFLCRHLRIVCANLGIKLSRARPYAAWSKGKIERFFRRVQGQFQATLVFDPVHSLGELNGRFATWLEGRYHQEEHRSTGEPPACRFMANSAAIKPAPPDADLRRLFLFKDTRRVRKDATVSVDGRYFELTPALRGQQVEVRYDPRLLDEVEIWHQDRFVQIANRLDRHANAKHFKPRDNHE